MRRSSRKSRSTRCCDQGTSSPTEVPVGFTRWTGWSSKCCRRCLGGAGGPGAEPDRVKCRSRLHSGSPARLHVFGAGRQILRCDPSLWWRRDKVAGSLGTTARPPVTGFRGLSPGSAHRRTRTGSVAPGSPAFALFLRVAVSAEPEEGSGRQGGEFGAVSGPRRDPTGVVRSSPTIQSSGRGDWSAQLFKLLRTPARRVDSSFTSPRCNTAPFHRAGITRARRAPRRR